MKLLFVVYAAVGAITATVSNQALNNEVRKNARARFRNGHVQRQRGQQRTLDQKSLPKISISQFKSAMANAQAKLAERRRAMRKLAQMMAMVNSYEH